MRALRIPRDPSPPQALEADVLRRWTARRRELLLVEQLDALVRVLGRLVAALERRAA
jgi:hypothetical protein